jgi:EAL domain-containing protein (putative c-di-GMP-specific phosphodiesterase class I)
VEDPETLLKNADVAMYRAKEQGRNTYQHFSPAMNARAFERLALATSLRHALDRGQFLLHYQPQMDLATRRIIGMEALVRWQHPEWGMVPPGKFIPLSEENGLILPIGEWVLKAACEQNKTWQKAGLTPIRVAVNLSARQFKQQNLLATVEEVLVETGLSAQHLELELTEGLIMDNAEHTIATLTELNRMGVRLSIDDFGIGYSSLSYLKRFPVHSLKIDQSFVRDLTKNQGDAAIVRAIITLAHSLNLSVLAEAVETPEQLAFLQSLACDQVQGYLFSPPLPGPQATELLTQNRLQAILPARPIDQAA